MLEFREEIIQCVYRLRDRYGSKRNCVVMAYPIIEIINFWKLDQRDLEISTKLFYSQDTGLFEMQAPDQKFSTRISYFDYNRPERRWTRSMSYLFPLVKDLKICGLWDFISNKDLIVLNQLNEKASSEKRQKILDLLLSKD